MKELARVDNLRDGVGKVEPCHRVVREFGVDADHLGFVQSGDEAEHRARSGQIDVASRLVGFGLERKSIPVALILAVLAQKVDRFAEPRKGVEQLAARVHLGTFAPAPEDIGFRAQLRTQIHRAHRFLQSVGAYPRVR